MKQNGTYTICREVRYTKAFDEGVVLRQKAGEVLVLNEVGLKVLELIGGGISSLDDIVDAVHESYEIDRSTALSDIAAYLDELESAGVIELDEE